MFLACPKRFAPLVGAMGLMILSAVMVGTWASGRTTQAESTAPAAEVAAKPSDGLLQPGVLRIAADPNNMPFSNRRGEGFENKIAELIAKDLGVKTQYVWRAQRRGFIRETIKAGEADVMIGVPTSLDMVLPTIAYYRSGYAFVYRRKLDALTSFDDPRLKTLRIGVPMAGDDGTPPMHALAQRGIIQNVHGFPVTADYAYANPTARILEAVQKQDVDVAVVWGPLAGYFAHAANAPNRPGDALALSLVGDESSNGAAAQTGAPFAFSISAGVRRGNKALKARLDAIIEKRQGDIDKILDSYHVPRLELTHAPRAAASTGGAGFQPCDCD